MAMDVEAEIRDLKRRVGELEGSFGFLATQISGVHKDLLAFQAWTHKQFDKVETNFQDVRQEIRSVRRDVQTLRKDMPGIVVEALRDTLGERRSKREPKRGS